MRGVERGLLRHICNTSVKYFRLPGLMLTVHNELYSGEILLDQNQRLKILLLKLLFNESRVCFVSVRHIFKGLLPRTRIVFYSTIEYQLNLIYQN